LWILKELLLHLKKADPEAGFLTAVASGDEALHSKTKRAITLKNKLSDPNAILESDPAKGDTIVKKYLHKLKLVQNNQRMLAIFRSHPRNNGTLTASKAPTSSNG
jgi:hypothetical protein